MAAEHTHRELTEADISDFGRQLYEFSKRLPMVQRGMLHRVLSRAAAGEHDTAGFTMADFESMDLAQIEAMLTTALMSEKD
jgi:hypothetical protein